MSGVHWNYLAVRLHERAAYAGEIWNLLGFIERELDYGLEGGICYGCAKVRVIKALEAYFDGDAESVENSAKILSGTDPVCEQCTQYGRPCGTIQLTHGGKDYTGVLYPAKGQE